MVDFLVSDKDKIFTAVLARLRDGRSSPHVKLVSTLSNESVSVSVLLLSMVSQNMCSVLRDVTRDSDCEMKVLVPVEIEVLKNLVKFIGKGVETFDTKTHVAAVGQAAQLLGISTADWEVEEGDMAKKAMAMVPIKKTYECDLCQKSFIHKHTFARHEYKVHGATSNVTFNCSPCKKTFHRKNELNNHKQGKKHKKILESYSASTTLHSGEFEIKDEFSSIVPKVPKCVPMKKKVKVSPPISGYGKRKFVNGVWVCGFCHVSFPTYGRLNTHLEKMHNVKISKFTCNVCDYTTYHKKDLKQHNKTKRHLRRSAGLTDSEGQEKEVKQDLLLYSCDQCQLTFLSQNQYKSHLRSSKKHKQLIEGEGNQERPVKLEVQENTGGEDVTTTTKENKEGKDVTDSSEEKTDEDLKVNIDKKLVLGLCHAVWVQDE